MCSPFPWASHSFPLGMTKKDCTVGRLLHLCYLILLFVSLHPPRVLSNAYQIWQQKSCCALQNSYISFWLIFTTHFTKSVWQISYLPFIGRETEHWKDFASCLWWHGTIQPTLPPRLSLTQLELSLQPYLTPFIPHPLSSSLCLHFFTALVIVWYHLMPLFVSSLLSFSSPKILAPWKQSCSLSACFCIPGPSTYTFQNFKLHVYVILKNISVLCSIL